MTNLKDNIWIEGFNTNEELYNFKDELCIVGEKLPYLYIGKTLEIPEELAKKCVISYLIGHMCYNKKSQSCTSYVSVKTAKESIQSACDKEYCIIYKKL